MLYIQYKRVILPNLKPTAHRVYFSCCIRGHFWTKKIISINSYIKKAKNKKTLLEKNIYEKLSNRPMVRVRGYSNCKSKIYYNK